MQVLAVHPLLDSAPLWDMVSSSMLQEERDCSVGQPEKAAAPIVTIGTAILIHGFLCIWNEIKF